MHRPEYDARGRTVEQTAGRADRFEHSLLPRDVRHGLPSLDAYDDHPEQHRRENDRRQRITAKRVTVMLDPRGAHECRANAMEVQRREQHPEADGAIAGWQETDPPPQ